MRFRGLARGPRAGRNVSREAIVGPTQGRSQTAGKTDRKSGGPRNEPDFPPNVRLCAFRLCLLALLATVLAGCTVPLGPGFRLRSRQMVLVGAPVEPAPVRLRVVDQLQNTGNDALTYLDVRLPAGVDLTKNRLTIRVDGKPVVPTAESPDPAAPFRVKFVPPWPVRQRREIVLEYDLSTNPASGGVASETPNGFYLADPHALPFWLTPVGVFSSGEMLTRDERIEVALPADFRVVASGKQRRKRTADGRFLYRFRTPGKGLPSFVIAGRYQQQVAETPDGELVFWTFQPLDPSLTQMAANRLTATVATFVRLFGPFPKPGPLRVVQAPAGLLPPAIPDEGVAAASFPQGLLLGPHAFDKGLASEPVLRVAEAELARIWFGWRVPLGPNVDTLLGRGLGLFAVALAAEARGGQPARRMEIMRLLEEYDRARISGDDGALLRPPEECTPQQLAANALKAALFLAGLEDDAGQDQFEQAIRRLQFAMVGRGLSLSLDDLRSSLETSTGTSLADTFRLWLNHPGVPEDFRQRYSASSARLFRRQK
jgi:hypothetical protein